MARLTLPRPDIENLPGHLPVPIEAGIGLVAELSSRGLDWLVNARERAERTYEELANRGETVVAGWRHQPAPRQTQAVPAAPPAPPAEIVLDRDDLPILDYDHLTLGSLRARLAKLDPADLRRLSDYERAHANRLPVLTMLENRLAKVTTS